MTDFILCLYKLYSIFQNNVTCVMLFLFLGPAPCSGWNIYWLDTSFGCLLLMSPFL